MSVLVAVAIVGLASLLLRTVPLLAGHRLPVRVVAGAECAGVSAAVALVVRALVQHRDAGIPGPPFTASIVALVAASLTYRLTFTGRPVLVAFAAGTATYLLLAAALATVL